MINQSYSTGINDSKTNSSLFNNTISCYQRPKLNYYMNTKSKNKGKKERSFINHINNKENINLNCTLKKPNFLGIYKRNNKNSLSKNIAFLCGVINSLNDINSAKKINNNIKELIKEKNVDKKKDNKIKIINKNIKSIIIIQKRWRRIYKNKLIKIKLIQKQWKNYIKNKNINDYYYFSFKKLISSPKNNKSNLSTNSNSNNINLIKSFQEENNKDLIYIKFRKKFISYSTQRLSKFFILVLNKLNLFNFIKILSQRINKSINQFVFYIIYYCKITTDINNNIFFFETIKRHLKANLNIDEKNINEVSILLRKNIPKYFKDDFNRDYIPFINKIQENNIIKTQLFLFNNEKLINYIIYFFEKENGKIFDDKNKTNIKKYIKNELNMNKLKNNNIFGIMRYINYLQHNYENYNNLYSKLQIMHYKESYHSENVKEEINKINESGDELIENVFPDLGKNIGIKKFKIKFNYMNNNE